MLLARICQALIRDGALTLIDADGTAHRFGRPARAADVVVRLHDRSLHHKLALSPFVTLGEAYVDGTLTVERGDVYALLDVCARNFARVASRPELRLGRALGRARSLVEERLLAPRPAPELPDLSDVLFDCFLDWDRQASCALFSDPRMSLEEAQDAKKQHLASKLLLRPGQKVLDVGSGWGGLALHLAETAGVDVTGITRSSEQLAIARRRAAEAELAGRVTFRLSDVREERGSFDRIVSVGALEQRGAPDLACFFEKIRDLLADDGVAVIHSIARMDGPAGVFPWLRKHALPGARVPALSEIWPILERARLWVTDVEILRLHYAETLLHWRRRFVSSWEKVAEAHGDRFCRTWEFYLALGEAAFRHGALMVFELQLAKRVDAVPLTRDYMYERVQTAEYEVGVAA